MKILVHPHRLEVGGSQTNALDLAIGLRARGHELVFFGTPGPFVSRIEERGFRYLPAPEVTATPSPTMVLALARAIRQERPDLLHAWDWPQYFNAAIAGRVGLGVPVVGSNMSMAVSRSAPRAFPLTYGTAELAEEAASIQSAPVILLEPPVNTDDDDPAVVDGAPFRREWGIGDDETVFVVVSRLVGWLKAEGIRRSMRAMEKLAVERRVRLVVVGGGTAQAELSALAEEINTAAGAELVTLTGPMIDPRPAYAAADVVIGMGGSILRGISFGKPAVVLGEQGFSEVFEPSSAALFLREGFYGLGPGSSTLEEQLARVARDAELRAELSGWGRRLVVERFSHLAAAARLEEFLLLGLDRQPSRLVALADVSRASAARLAAKLLRR